MFLIIPALLLTISTSMDYLLILIVLFSSAKTASQRRGIYLGQLLGSFFLICISVAFSRAAYLLPAQWMIGLLGIAPILLGLKILLSEEEERNLSKNEIGAGTVFLLSIAAGADNLGIFTPYFTTLSPSQCFLSGLLILMGTGLICWLADRFGRFAFISEWVEKLEKWLLPVVFIGLGCYILFEFGTIDYMFQWLI